MLLYIPLFMYYFLKIIFLKIDFLLKQNIWYMLYYFKNSGILKPSSLIRYLVFVHSFLSANYLSTQLLFMSFSTGIKAIATIYTFLLLSIIEKINKPEFQ